MSDKLIYCPILKTNINVINMTETVDFINEHMDELRGDYICISNVHTTVMAYHDDKYRKVQNEAAMALPDGKPLSIVSKMRGFHGAERVPGPDLMPELFRLSEKKGYSHYFYGSTQDTLDKLQEAILKEYPKLNIAGMYSPPFRNLSSEEEQEIINTINETHADFIWVGLGAPKQEFWMAKHKGKVCGLMLGVGAGFDFHAGTVKRAPRWMQECCLEWLHRLLQDPMRLLPRYISTNFSFLWNVHKENRQIKKLKKLSDRPLKIAMIGHKRIPTREGGVEIVVNELATRMVERGNQVDAYNRRGSHVSGKEFVSRIGKEYCGIRIISIPTFESKSLNAIVYSFLASIRALFGRYDVIHYHAEGPCAMLWIPKIFGKRVVVTIHGLDWQRSKWGNLASRVLKFGERLAAKHADEVIVLSSNMKEYFREVYGRETVFIPNGIALPERREAKEIREKWKLSEDEYILFLARIVPEKGIHYLIQAYQELSTDKKLVIAGGSSHSKEYFCQLKEMAAGDDNIIFTDFVGGRTLEELYSNAYLFVLPSDVEGMAIGLLEAMSYGNCCIVSDIAENTEVVEDNAVTFKHGDAEDLQRQMEMLLLNPEKVQGYRKTAADFICHKYDWDCVVDRTLDVYRGVK